MKPASAGLIALLADSNTFVMWEVYTITLVDGTVITWTSNDVGGSATGPVLDTGEATATLTG